MRKIKDNIDLKELEKFGFEEMPNEKGCYKKSIARIHTGIDSDITEWFIYIGKDRIIRKFEVWSYLFKVYYEKEKHLFKFRIKDLIKSDMVENVE